MSYEEIVKMLENGPLTTLEIVDNLYPELRDKDIHKFRTKYSMIGHRLAKHVKRGYLFRIEVPRRNAISHPTEWLYSLTSLVTTELCSYCECEVDIPLDRASSCPRCGNRIVPCSMCPQGHEYCSACPFEVV